MKGLTAQAACYHQMGPNLTAEVLLPQQTHGDQRILPLSPRILPGPDIKDPRPAPVHHPRGTVGGVGVYYCSTYYKAVREGGGRNGGHVLRETTSRGRCKLVCPSRTNERGGEGYCVKEGEGEEGERESVCVWTSNGPDAFFSTARSQPLYQKLSFFRNPVS